MADVSGSRQPSNNSLSNCPAASENVRCYVQIVRDLLRAVLYISLGMGIASANQRNLHSSSIASRPLTVRSALTDALEAWAIERWRRDSSEFIH